MPLVILIPLVIFAFIAPTLFRYAVMVPFFGTVAGVILWFVVTSTTRWNFQVMGVYSWSFQGFFSCIAIGIGVLTLGALACGDK